MDSTRKPEKENPKRFAGIFSRLIFAWSIPLLHKGTKHGLNTEDLTKCLPEDTSRELGDKLEENWEKEVEKAHHDQRDPLLRNAMLKTFWPTAVTDGFICLIYITIKSLLPEILGQLLVQYQKTLPMPKSALDEMYTSNRSRRSVDSHSDLVNTLNEEKVPQSVHVVEADDVPTSMLYYIWNDIYWLGVILVVFNLITCFLLHHVELRQSLLGARMRIACCSLIYRKTLRLSMKTVGGTPAGYLINLLSNDATRLDYGFMFVHWIWILPLQAVLICYLIWLRVGYAALIGVIGLLLKTVPVQTGLSKLASKLRMRIAECTDQRVGIMNELVQGIQVIKMYAWEKPFQMVVAEARRREIKQIRYASYLRGFYLSTFMFMELSTLYITVLAAWLLGNTITADFVYSASSYFNILQLVAAIYYPLAVSFAAEAFVSIERMQAYLLVENRDDTEQQIPQTHSTYELQKTKMKSSSESISTHVAIRLKEINGDWDASKKKPTLQDITLDVEKGLLCAVIGPVGAGKSSLLQAILGELPISSGSMQIQGNLSYASQEPWLFTGTVRNNILFGEVYDQQRYQEVTRCCALSTDFQQLPNRDKTLVGERGASLSGGQRARISLARAVYKPASIYLLDDPLSAVDAHVGRHLFDEVIGPNGCLAREKATRVLITHQVHFLDEADWIVIIENGRISLQGTYDELTKCADVNFANLLERPKEETSVGLATYALAAENLPSYDEHDPLMYIDGAGDDYQPVKRQDSNDNLMSKKVFHADQVLPELDDDELDEEELAEGNVSARIWWEYFRYGSTYMGLGFMIFIMVLSQVGCSGTAYFVNFFTQQEYLVFINEIPDLTTKECLIVYTLLIVAVVALTIYRGFLFFKVCMHASKALHDHMFGCILHATMRFFDTNPSGRILNRFSKDMGTIDEYLPKAMMDFIQIALVMFGILIVITIVNPILLVAIVLMAYVDYLLLQLFLKPSQDMKRLEGICRSPVYSHASATLTGLATIRARGLQETLETEFDHLQDVHSSIWQLTTTSKTALGLWLDSVSCCFLIAVTFSFILFTENSYSGDVGLAISQTLILTGMVQYGVREVAESMQLMTSVERILQYTDLKQESDVNKQPPTGWPAHGQIEFKNMSYRYDPNAAAVLQHLNVSIQPNWKVGIVGRTGAGKSSLIGVLFRMADIEGDVVIDGIETGTISLEALRSQISIIPQDPVLFSATIRYNLDPFEKYTDAELWSALESVELKGAIPGLDYMVTERGSNFSVGQRQLLCLARAILRNNKVLVLDEATANVDPQTDALIQHTIRAKFNHCTVLTVAHRLHTVMDSDRILVMDAGMAREFDMPHVLLQKPDGALRQMVEATGGEAEALKKTANEAYHSKKLLGAMC